MLGDAKLIAVVSLSRPWTMVLFVAVCAAAASAAYVAWTTRHLVGLEDRWSCTLDPAWRAHLAWWFLPIGIAMLTASAWSLLQAIRGRGNGKTGLPLVVCVAGLASLWSLNAMAFGGFDAGCSSTISNELGYGRPALR